MTGIGNDPTMMNRGRWYPQLTKLHDGKVIAISGYKYESQEIEIRHEWFNPANETWTEYDDSVDLAAPLYNAAYLIPFGDWKGEVFYDLVSFGPELPGWIRAHRFNPDFVSPEWNQVGIEQGMRLKGNSVMLPFHSSGSKIQIINLGGGDETLSITSQLIEIGAGVTSQWIPIGDLNHNRHDSPNALLLADGTLMVIGGGHDMETVLTPEYLDYNDPDPENWRWQTMPDMEVPRKYHSTALLLPDATVWVAGSRIYTEPQRWEFENDMERRIEIFKPGYLFDGHRPVIDTAPLEIENGDTAPFELALSIDPLGEPQIDSVVLISMANVTHCFDCNQRYIILDFVALAPQKLEVMPPLDGYIAPPGYYMLFVLNDISKSNSGLLRIPSVAKIVKVI